jgi:hypothetical protein
MRLFRLLIAFAILACLSPLISTALAGWIASSHGCTLHEGFASPCVIKGTDYGETLYTMGVMGWLMLATLPIAAGFLLLWIVAEVVAFIRRKRAA